MKRKVLYEIWEQQIYNCIRFDNLASTVQIVKCYDNCNKIYD